MRQNFQMHRKMKTNRVLRTKTKQFRHQRQRWRVRLNFVVEVITSTFAILLVCWFGFNSYKIPNTMLNSLKSILCALQPDFFQSAIAWLKNIVYHLSSVLDLLFAFIIISRGPNSGKWFFVSK